jgi:hypothetical protein
MVQSHGIQIRAQAVQEAFTVALVKLGMPHCVMCAVWWRWRGPGRSIFGRGGGRSDILRCELMRGQYSSGSKIILARQRVATSSYRPS